MSYIILITGPSGVGKTTVIEKLRERVPDLVFVPSYSTREMREGESDGNPYFFVSESEFFKMRDNGEFIEYFNNYGNWYGSPLRLHYEYMEQGFLLIKAIDVRGAKAFKHEFGDRALTVFLAPPSLKELSNRMEKRDGIVDLVRLSKAKEEMDESPYFDFTVVNNNINTTVDLIVKIFNAVKEYSSRV